MDKQVQDLHVYARELINNPNMDTATRFTDAVRNIIGVCSFKSVKYKNKTRSLKKKNREIQEKLNEKKQENDKKKKEFIDMIESLQKELDDKQIELDKRKTDLDRREKEIEERERKIASLMEEAIRTAAKEAEERRMKEEKIVMEKRKLEKERKEIEERKAEEMERLEEERRLAEERRLVEENKKREEEARKKEENLVNEIDLSIQNARQESILLENKIKELEKARKRAVLNDSIRKNMNVTTNVTTYKQPTYKQPQQVLSGGQIRQHPYGLKQKIPVTHTNIANNPYGLRSQMGGGYENDEFKKKYYKYKRKYLLGKIKI